MTLENGKECVSFDSLSFSFVDAPEIIWGAAINPDFEDQMMITVIATGFDEQEATEKISVPGLPAMPFDALVVTNKHAQINTETDEKEFNPDSPVTERASNA